MSNNKRALITGITGQDGSYLAEFLYEKGYQVHGITRQPPPPSHQDYIFHQTDLSDSWGLQKIIGEVQPDEIYNLGAISNEKQSFERAEYTLNINGLMVLDLLEIIRCRHPKTRLFQAASSELFGKASHMPQNETTTFRPRSPYGIAKLYAYWSIVNYREAYSLYACNGILFNHESPRRGELFVTRKIAQGAVRIKNGLQEKLLLGNLDVQRDWGYAKDFVEAMWLMLQQNQAEDFVLGTGKLVSVRQFVEIAFAAAGISIAWQGIGPQEKGIDRNTGKICIEISPLFYRPNEEIPLVGDSAKAQKKLLWSAKTTVEQLIHLMVENEKTALTNPIQCLQD